MTIHKLARNRKFGWKPDLPDHRDFSFKIHPKMVASLPSKIDLRSKMPDVYNQGDLGSCTANAIGAAMEFLQGDATKWVPSRLFVYYKERVAEGTTSEDSGAQIRTGIKVVNKIGACHEDTWPYDIPSFTKRPSTKATREAKKFKASRYERVDNSDIDNIRGALAEGFPVVFGFSVYTYFCGTEIMKTGILKMPGLKEKQMGGHAVLAVGYDHTKKRVLVRNSWGEKWGLGGYFWMPYAYISDTNLSDDFWVIRGVAEV